jgi:non-heme Fe2+,alpha-ketoglutarate-dependent halogenase
MRTQVLSAMMRGFESLEAFRAKHPLDAEQRRRLDDAVAGIAKYREYLRLTQQAFERPPRRFDAPEPRLLALPAGRRREVDGGHYLSEAEGEAFRARGLLGPFRVLSTEQAHALAAYVRAQHARDWDGRLTFRGPVEDALREAGLWSLNYSGAYQALYHRPLWDALAHEAIAQRMASLLGDDVICWRSQIFEKRPGAEGTFWHQAGTFRESSARPKLEPPPGRDYAAVQFTAWIALTDSTIRNGTLRFMPASFYDSRPEDFFFHAMEHLPTYLSRLPDEEVAKFLHVLWFSSGNFYRARALLELAITMIDDLFEGREVADVEVAAGECVIFSSMNMHASYPNLTRDETRLALAGRYTRSDVRVLPGFDHDLFPTPKGLLPFGLEHTGCMLVHGENRGVNKLRAPPAS